MLTFLLYGVIRGWKNIIYLPSLTVIQGKKPSPFCRFLLFCVFVQKFVFDSQHTFLAHVTTKCLQIKDVKSFQRMSISVYTRLKQTRGLCQITFNSSFWPVMHASRSSSLICRLSWNSLLSLIAVKQKGPETFPSKSLAILIIILFYRMKLSDFWSWYANREHALMTLSKF